MPYVLCAIVLYLEEEKKILWENRRIIMEKKLMKEGEN